MSRLAGKLFAGLFLMCLLLSMLAGCGEAPSEPWKAPAPRQDAAPLRIYTDGMTGCEYVGRMATAAGITPRIASDGKTHMGCAGAKP